MYKKHVAVLVAGCSLWALGSAPSLRGQDKPTGKEVRYEFKQDLAPYVGIWRSGKVVLGHLDAAGNFVPLPRVEPINPADPFSGPAYAVLNRPLTPNEPVYEYRSGYLIKGSLDKEGNFIPEEGSKIIPLREYRYSPRALRIYNLPGKFVEKTGNGSKEG